MAEIFPYDVFNTEGKSPSIPSHHYEAYELPDGRIKILTDSNFQPEFNFSSRAEADKYLSSVKSDSHRDVSQLNPLDYGKILSQSISFDDAKVETKVPSSRVQKEKPEQVDDKPKPTSKEKKQEDRIDNKAPEKEGKKTEETKEEYAGGTFLEDVEHWIPSLFQPAQQGIASLKNELLENTQDGGSPILGALAASGLDLLDTAMGMTQGIPLGILDIRNIGEGTEEALIALEEGGDASDVIRGIKKDASRALTIAGYIIPEGVVLKAANRALAGADIIESLSQGDFKSASTQLAMAALHEKAKSKLNNKRGKSNSKDKGNDSMQSGSDDNWLHRSISGNEKLLKLVEEIKSAKSNNDSMIPLPRGIKLKLKELGNLSSHLGVELAVVSKRTRLGRERSIIVGEVNSVKVGDFLRGGNTNRVVLHTHPGLQLKPSRADIGLLNSRASIYLEQGNFGVRAGQSSSVIIDEFGNSQKFRAMFSGSEFSKLESYWKL